MDFFEKTFCDRCGKNLRTFVSTMSRFNTDRICMPCARKEKVHPDYEIAAEMERLAVKHGIRNYPGIGKPKDL